MVKVITGNDDNYPSTILDYIHFLMDEEILDQVDDLVDNQVFDEIDTGIIIQVWRQVENQVDEELV